MSDTQTQPVEQSREHTSAYWRYWTASTVSSTGSGVTTLALPLVALTVLDASNFEVGLLTALGYAAIIVMGLPSGVIAQRFPLRSLQVTMDLSRFVAVLTVPVAAWLGVLTLPHLMIVAFFVGLASNIFDVANSTFLPSIVPKQDLIARNSFMSSTHATTQLAAPSLGGLLVQTIGAASTMILDALSYLASALLLSSIRITGTASPVQRKPPFREMASGLRFVFGHPVIRSCALLATAINFGNGVLHAMVTPFLVRTLGLPPGWVGLIIALDGVGTVIGAALTARIARRLGTARALLVFSAVGAVVTFAMPLAVGPWSAATCTPCAAPWTR